MSEKPILFNTRMVQAILEGRKTCTRRVIKPQPNPCDHKTYEGAEWKNEPTKWVNNGDNWYCVMCGNGISCNINRIRVKGIRAPYQVGDILYVRETWAKIDGFENYADVEIPIDLKYFFKCDDNGKEHTFIDLGVKRWRPSIHMPKEAARIFLKVIDVRVERLQDITEEQAKAEGCIDFNDKIGDGKFEDVLEFDLAAKDAFSELWNSTVKRTQLNNYGWNANPWVWVISFERMEGK